ncbi:MAG: BON domain-containing protein [Hyphomonadaceae bacterium]
MAPRLLVGLVLVTLPLTGCIAAVVGTAGAVGVAAVQDKTIGEALDDAAVSSEIKTKLLSDNATRFGEVDVEVTGGLVLLSGRVNSPQDRVKSEEIAWSARGTQDVANEIRIEPPGGFIANVSDELITARIRTALLTSRTVRSYNFNIETYDGVVYLMGIARTAGELQHAAEKASYVGGVKQVVSYVQIRELRPTTANKNTAPSSQNAPSDTYIEPYGSDGELLGGS